MRLLKNLLFSVFLLLPCGYLQAEESAVSFHTPFSKKLENQMQKNGQVRANPGMGRFAFMRFYFPTNTVREEPGVWAKLKGCETDTLVRAQAIYLFNMYVSTAAYKEDVPGSLTVDYVGVLDGFHRCANGFAVKDAVSFYQKHQREIQALLKQFFDRRGLSGYEMNRLDNQAREKAFLKVLVNSVVADKKYPGYRASGASRLTGANNGVEVNILKDFLQRALRNGSNKFVFFEQREVFGPEFDTPIAHQKVQTHTICRGANEECAACSYLLGREMCAEITAKHRNWGLMRIYRITAKPMRGGLKAADRSGHFTLANGKKSVPWDYHVATLVLMNLDGKYTPYVIDKFLAGFNPISPNAWFSKFALSETFFLITPFERTEQMEERFYRKDSKGRDVRAF